jgi:hypothetical protein
METVSRCKRVDFYSPNPRHRLRPRVEVSDDGIEVIVISDDEEEEEEQVKPVFVRRQNCNVFGTYITESPPPLRRDETSVQDFLLRAPKKRRTEVDKTATEGLI